MITESFSLPVIVILLLIMLWFFLEEVRDLSLFAKRSAKKEVTNLSTLRALSLFEHHDDIVAVDVRPAEKYGKRRLPGAINAPFEEGAPGGESIADLDRDTPLLVYCDGGYRSRQSLDAFVGEGFTKVFHLNRGLMMWQFFGGPTETDQGAS